MGGSEHDEAHDRELKAQRGTNRSSGGTSDASLSAPFAKLYPAMVENQLYPFILSRTED